MIKIDCNLIYERIKKMKRSLDLGSRFIVKEFFVVLLFACFLLFVFLRYS